MIKCTSQGWKCECCIQALVFYKYRYTISSAVWNKKLTRQYFQVNLLTKG